MSFFLIFILGLSVGSFINAIIYRLKKKKPISFDRSHCPYCRVSLKWPDLIPIVSFILLSGKCRYCRKKISFQYPLVELMTGLLFLMTFYSFGYSLITFYYLTIISLLIIIFVYDLKYYLIPDKIVYPAVIIAFLYLFFEKDFISHFLSAILASGFFLLLVLVSKGKWMGLGDVKLAFLMGLILGWPGILIALFISFFSGAVIGLTLIVLGKKKMKSEIPFGPFLAGSTVLVIFLNQCLIDWFNACFINIWI